MQKIKVAAEALAKAKIEQFKQWVYKHYVGVYMAIGVAICTVCFLFGFGYGVII